MTCLIRPLDGDVEVEIAGRKRRDGAGWILSGRIAAAADALLDAWRHDPAVVVSLDGAGRYRLTAYLPGTVERDGVVGPPIPNIDHGFRVVVQLTPVTDEA